MPGKQWWYYYRVPLDDRALVAALVAGDPSGLEGAYRAYADRVYTLCHRLLDDLDAAADACHDAFVVASQRAYRLPDPDQLPAWLVALARNECVRRLRGVDRRAALAQPEPEQLLPAPPLLWPRLELYCFDPDVAPEREAIVRRAGRLDPRTGFPQSWHARRRRRLAVAGIAAVAMVVLAAGAGTALRPDEPTRSARAAGPNESAVASVSPTGSPTSTPTPTPSPTPSPSPTPAPSSPLPSSPSPIRPPVAPPPALTVEAEGEFDCMVGGLFGYRLAVTATASQPLDTAQLHVATGDGTDVYEMTIDGRAASATSDLMASLELEWWVEATAAGGQSVQTAPTEVTAPCAG